jgi:hypothetical protein
MARIEGAKRIVAAGKILIVIGAIFLTLWAVMIPVGGMIPVHANVPWRAINASHDFVFGIGLLALGSGIVLRFSGWVIMGFLE